MLVVGAVAGTASVARADGPPVLSGAVKDSLFMELALASTFATVGVDESITALGINTRLGGSLRYYLTGMDDGGLGLRFNDFWVLDLSTGYISADGPTFWFDGRVEATIRAVYAANPELDVVVRAGYLTGNNNARAGLYNAAYDALFATLGVRSGRVQGEVGAGAGGIDGSDGAYLLATAEYRARTSGVFQNVGLRFERIGASDEFPTSINLRLTFSSN